MDKKNIKKKYNFKKETVIFTGHLRKLTINTKIDSIKQKLKYRQRLPHIQPIGSTFFVTFRLYGSIPYSQLNLLKKEYNNMLSKLKDIKDIYERNKEISRLRLEYFFAYDKLLDNIKTGPKYMEKDEVAKIIADQLHRFDGEYYDLIAYSIMHNHVHILIDTGIQLPEEIGDVELLEQYKQLDGIMQRIKGASAFFANKALGLKGQFWERESFDRYIRHVRMFGNVVDYILMNPVKAGIVDKWEDYRWSFLKYNN